jgi:opacity protein-like surface antigen
MIRAAAGAVLAVMLGVAVSAADEVKGTVKSVDKDKNTITLTVDGKETTFDVSKDASFVTTSTVPGKKGKTMEKATPIDGGLGGVKAGATVTVLTEKIDDKESVTSVKVSDGTATAKQKKKKKE